MLTVVCHHCRSSARITVLQMMANFDNYPWISLRRMAGLALFTFCNNFVQIGNQSAAQPQKIYTICWLTLLFFLTHKPSPPHPSSPLHPHPLLDSARETSEPLSPIRAEVIPTAFRCLSPPRSQLLPFNSSLLFSPHALMLAFNSSLLFSPHAPKSILQ